MKSFIVERVKGKGLATNNGFPTINIQLALDSINEGAWICRIHIGDGWKRQTHSAIASVSKYKGCLATEIHVYDKNIDIKEGEEFTIVFIKKLRDKKLFKDPIEQIKADIESARSSILKTCDNCDRFYSKDYGYSNYTIEGTSFGCFAEQFTEMEDNADVRFNGVDCKYYTNGNMWMFDVDGEVPYPKDEWFLSLKRDMKLIDLLD